MKDNNKLFEYRFFTPADFREEQSYLELRHRQGWAFDGVRRFKYSFKRAPQCRMSYVRDYKEDDIFVDDYTEMYEADGWEFVYRTFEAYYFRKKEVVFPEELEVFSTYYDRAQYFGKLQMRMMSDVFAVVLVAMLWVITAGVAGAFAFNTFVDVIAVILGFVLLFTSALVLVLLYLKYRKIMSISLTPAQEQERAAIAEEIAELSAEKSETEQSETEKSTVEKSETLQNEEADGETEENSGFTRSELGFEDIFNARIK